MRKKEEKFNSIRHNTVNETSDVAIGYRVTLATLR